MAQKMVLLDDMEDREVEASAGTIPFSLEGRDWEIDLSTANQKKLRDALAPFIKHARRAGKGTASKAKTKSTSSPEHLNAIRDWARSKGHTVSPRGRIPAEIVIAFEEAHAAGTPSGRSKTAAKKAANESDELFSSAV